MKTGRMRPVFSVQGVADHEVARDMLGFGDTGVGRR